MAYHGLIPILQQYLVNHPTPPKVLEVGVDRGVTAIPLLIAMGMKHREFMFVGVDIKVQESTVITVSHLPRPIPASAFFIEKNSLEVLPSMVGSGEKFDLILLDGDHNYHTVSQEMGYLGELISDKGIIVIDDYDGKWSDRDLWYAERPDYEEVEQATQRQETEHHGVKPAVDEWLEAHPEWQKHKPVQGEPILLARTPI